MLGALFEQEQEEDFSMLVDYGVIPTDTTEWKGKKKMEKPADPRDPLGFVGLQNQGATCYLNSLIQVMYMTPELRDGLYKVDPLELGVAHIEEHEKEKANLEKKGSVEPDDNMMETLLAMGVQEATARYALIKTKNKGIEDAFECIMELGDSPPPAEEAPKKKKKPRYVPLELQRLFSELQMVDKAAISTEDLTSKGFNWQSFDGRVQHDAHELNRLLVDALEKSLKKTSGDALCKTLYEGTMVNQILCTKCHRISEREESFYDLNMQVVDCSDVAQALHNFCKKEVLDGDSAYACETCGCKTRALRCSKLVRLPNILTFSCNRFKIDRSTNWQRVKVTSASDYPLALNMNPFVYGYALQDSSMDDDQSDTHMVSIAHNSMVWIDSLKAEAEGFLETCLANSGKALDDFQWSTQQIDQFRRQVVQRIEEQDPCMHSKVEDNYRYSLHAIIIHRGSAYSGHYYAYIRDNLHEASYLPTDPNAFKEPNANAEKNTSKKGSSSQKKTSDAGTQMDVDTSASTSTGGATASNATTTAVNVDIKDDYLFDEVTQNTFVRQDSLIHKILFVFEEEQTAFIKSMNKRRLSARKDKPFFLKGSAIARGMATHFQEPWAKLYKAHHGSVDDFLQRHKTLFVETEPSEFSLQPDLVTSIIPEDAFRSLYISKQPVYLPKLTTVLSTNTHTSGMDEDTAMDVDSDEALAKALQDSLNREANGGGRSTRSSSSGNAQESTAASAWQTAGKKRKGHKDASASSLSTSTDAAVTIVVDGSAQEQEDTARWIRQNLVEDLLRYTAGLFLEFNDSRVSQITYDTLQRAFKGVDSAYLIVYRRVRTFQDIFPQQLYTKTATTIPTALPAILAKTAAPVVAVAPTKSILPVPPPYWVDKIRSVNEELAVRRAEYHEQSQQRLVSIYFQSSLHYDKPCFLVHASSSSSSGSAEKASVNTPCLHVEMDTRKTIQDLLLTLFQPHIATYTGGESTTSGCGGMESTTVKNIPTVMGNQAAHQRLLKEFFQKYTEALAVSSSADAVTLTEAQLTHILSQVAVSRLEPVVALTQQGNVVEATKAYQHAYYASTPVEALTTSIGDFANRADAAVLRRVGNHCRLLIWLPSTAAAQGIVYGDRSRPVPIKTWVLESPYQRQQQQLQQQSKTTGSTWGKGKSAPANPAGSSSASSTTTTTATATATSATKKSNSSGSSGTVTDPNDIVVSNAVQLYYVPGHLTVFDTVLFLAGKYGLDAMRYIVRARVPDVAAATAAATATYSARTTRATTKAASTSDHSKVATIFDQGVVSLASSLQLLGQTVVGNNTFQETTPIGELWFVRELYVEDYTAQGFHKTSLAERFLSMQLHMITVTVEFDTSVIKVVQKQQQQQPEAHELPDSVDMEVFKTATIAMFKEKLLTGYGLLSATSTTATTSTVVSDTMDNDSSSNLQLSLETCRLRLGSKPGESVLEDETQTLEMAGIKSHMRLYLETGSHVRPRDTVIVNVLLVHGNSTQMKYTASEAGWRMGDPAQQQSSSSSSSYEPQPGDPKPLTMEVPLTVTVRELREMIGMRMLQFPSQWTEMEPVLWANQTVADPSSLVAPTTAAAAATGKSDSSSSAASGAAVEWKESLRHHAYYQHHEYRGRRLRRTSWMGEFAELLLETDKKTNAMTLKDADIKDGELLLLEEGRLPIRGMHDIAVYFWHDRPLLEVIDVDAPATRAGAELAALRPPVPPSTAMDVDPPATTTATASATVRTVTGTDGDRDVVIIDDDDNNNDGGDGTTPPSIAEQAAAAQRQRMACVHRLGEVQVSVNGTLGDMHHLVTRLVHRSREVLLQRMSASLPVTALLAAEAAAAREDDPQQSAGQLEALLEQCSPADRMLWEHMVNPEEYLLLREMRPDTLPGKCLWMVDSNNNQSATASTTTAAAAVTPVKGGGAKTASATSATVVAAATTTPSKTPSSSAATAAAAAAADGAATSHSFGHSHLGHTPIKKLSIKAERGLIVQLLPRPQMLERSSAGSIRIWVQRLLNPQQAAEGRAQLSPSWPPIAATLQGGIAPTLGHLHRAIMTAMPGIVTTPDQLVVYKYNLARFVWEEMKHLHEGQGSGSGSSGKKKAENLFQAPYNVKEGTLFCAFSKLDLITGGGGGAATANSKTLATISTAMDISLPLDIFMQQLKAEVALHKKQGRHVSGAGGGVGGPGARNDVLKKPEYALTLHLDLDDWDDE